MFLAKHNDKFFKIIEKNHFATIFDHFMLGYTQPYLMENIGLDVVLFWLSVHIQKNNEINEFHPEIYHIPDQRILQYHWLGAFSAITPEKEFQQKWDLYMKKIIHISFSLKMFLTKTNDKNFSKYLKNSILGAFLTIFLFIFAHGKGFLKNMALSHKTPQGPIIPCQISEKTM